MNNFAIAIETLSYIKKVKIMEGEITKSPFLGKGVPTRVVSGGVWGVEPKVIVYLISFRFVGNSPYPAHFDPLMGTPFPRKGELYRIGKL